MTSYYDKNGKEIYDGDYLIIYDDKFKDGVFCGVAKEHDDYNLYLYYADQIDDPHRYTAMSEFEQSKIRIFDDIEKFNSQFEQNTDCFYDEHGIRIEDGMCLDVSDKNGSGFGHKIKKVRGKLYFDFSDATVPLSNFYKKDREYTQYIRVYYIPLKYFNYLEFENDDK